MLINVFNSSKQTTVYLRVVAFKCTVLQNFKLHPIYWIEIDHVLLWMIMIDSCGSVHRIVRILKIAELKNRTVDFL